MKQLDQISPYFKSDKENKNKFKKRNRESFVTHGKTHKKSKQLASINPQINAKRFRNKSPQLIEPAYEKLLAHESSDKSNLKPFMDEVKLVKIKDLT